MWSRTVAERCDPHRDPSKPIDLTGHVLSPFYHRDIIYQDCKCHSIAHLMCYRYAIANNHKTFATVIRKWSRPLNDFPAPKFQNTDSTQQWLYILFYTHRYTYLYVTDAAFKSTLINTGSHPFTLQCISPWGCVPSDPDTCPHADLVCDVLVNVRVLASSDRLTQCRWLATQRHSRHSAWNAYR